MTALSDPESRMPPRRRRGVRHDNAIIQAEVRRLARAIAPYGFLHHQVVDPLPGDFSRQATRPSPSG